MIYKFCVITKVPDPETDSGNLAAAILHWDKEHTANVPEKDLNTVKMFTLMAARMEVFTLGEILIVNEDGRETFGNGRKPSKWFIEHETFDTIDEAIIRANQVVLDRNAEWEKKK